MFKANFGALLCYPVVPKLKADPRIDFLCGHWGSLKSVLPLHTLSIWPLNKQMKGMQQGSDNLYLAEENKNPLSTFTQPVQRGNFAPHHSVLKVQTQNLVGSVEIEPEPRDNHYAFVVVILVFTVYFYH